MEQLKVNDIFDCVNRLMKKGMQYHDIMKLPIYIGNDDELNGVHCGWYVELIDANDKEDYAIQMINEDFGNHKIKEKAILIS